MTKEADLNLKINAMVARNAEEYYRAMVRSDELSWNVRDEHMVEAINEIMDYHGKEAKIIIWEHNTHIGDASATDMKESGMVNVGANYSYCRIRKKMYLRLDLVHIEVPLLRQMNGNYSIKE